ncbi:hypothetical protein D3C80_2147140 [compost metagenome]
MSIITASGLKYQSQCWVPLSVSLALLAMLADRPERVSNEVLPAADMPITRYHGKS